MTVRTLTLIGSARLLADPLKVHIRDFADYDDDLTSFLEQVVKPISPNPPIALAHSMGGQILLRTLHGHIQLTLIEVANRASDNRVIHKATALRVYSPGATSTVYAAW